VVQLAGNSYFDIASRRSLAAALIRRSLNKASLVLVLGSSQVAAVQKIARRANVGVAPNGVSIPAFTSRMGEPYPLACHFLHIGYVSEAKGVTTALRALAQVRDGKREFRATFAGEWASPEERDRILGETSRLGLQDLVDFPGIVIGDAKESLLQEADVFLLPSFAEGQPISILEAMAHELPVIAASVGAIPDTVKDGQTGLLVECGDTEGLASAMERLIDDSAMRGKMGIAGAARFRERFTLARSHEILRDHFLRVAADCPRAVK
jgi:glycosyltransferase involved in cell wall biosynthesis